jgi:hypothetical protein
MNQKFVPKYDVDESAVSVGASFTPAFKHNQIVLWWNLNAGVKPAPTENAFERSLPGGRKQ